MSHVSSDLSPACSLVVMATNLPEALDPAIRRRMSLSLKLPSPTKDQLDALIKSLTKRWDFLEHNGWESQALEANSFAECEEIVLDAARKSLLD